VNPFAGDWWQRVRSGWPERRPQNLDEPLRAELLSAEQMALHGKRLAATHVLSAAARPDRLLARLQSNERVLIDVGRRLAAAAETERRFSPAAEWLLDNFYIIEEEIRTARRHLPRGYSRELPRLAESAENGTAAGLPRVYDLALQLIAHGDGHVSRSTLSRFVAAYQSVQPLLLGELWAIPIMLRLALIENLRRVAARVATAYDEREMAGAWADNMLDVADSAPSDLILLVADMARSAPPMTNAFVAEFARRLQGQGASLALPLTWFELRLAESGQTIQQLVQMEGQQQAANQVSVSNSIGSLRLLGTMDWREFVETLSGVEQTLRDDPSGVYAQMDFSTRDRYRHVVEAIARMSDASETEVARHAVELCGAASAAGERPTHVGRFLIGSDRIALERTVAARVPGWLALARWARARAMPLYAAALVVSTLSIAAWPLAQTDVRLPLWEAATLAVLVMVVASQLAVALVNWLVTLFVPPQRLPRMDYSFGIASASRTLVVVPTMLGSPDGVEALVEALEVRFLANRDPNLHFGLLTDLHDAPTEHLPTDTALVELAASRIEALNAKYRPSGDAAGNNPFYLFHRPRRWNARERVWMGYERKRGKLADLNALLRGQAGAGPGERFARIVGETLWLSAVRYVITLDTDTELPRGAAAEMVATMAHPLNHPRFGSGRSSSLVVDGYGILQPRIAASLPSTNRSLYARINGGEAGIDPYTRAVSDVYQDLFGEGSFIGKGIYDVDAFERALGDRLPENRILSHDLLEGCYARSGLLSDVQLIEDAPATYGADVARRYRWIRGDWQLIGWLRRRLHALRGAPPNPLSALSQAKIFDNLRRSLVPLASVLLLLAGWLVLPAPRLWTLFTVSIVALVPLATHVAGWLRDPLERLRAERTAFITAAASLPALRLLLHGLHTLACLPYEAAYSTGAIARTLWRVLLSKRRLLEWRPSSEVSVDTQPGTIPDLIRSIRTLALGPVVAIACAVGVALLRPQALTWAGAVLILWLVSPLLVWWLDRPLTRERVALTPAQRVFLRRLARRTWGFFEVHVTAVDHYLPPDNVQERPARVAHRTSPTNMGFALLAALAARGFGYLGTAELVERIDAALTTMEGMSRHRGHFYNWYDTTTLKPLRPRYVSTVDSGNLAAQLLTLRTGLLALADEPALPRGWLDGVHDGFGVMMEALKASPMATDEALARALSQFGQSLKSYDTRPPVTRRDWEAMLAALEAGAASIVAALGLAVAVDDGAPSEETILKDEGAGWAILLWKQCRAGCNALRALPATESSMETPGLPSPRQLAIELHDRSLLDKLEELAARAAALTEAEHGFLYDRTRHLMTIGYNVDERRPDTGYYDLLASEARLGVFVAIAQGHVGQESWFALGRLLTATAGAPVLVSWSGSMFEYLMPMLLMPSYENTLLHQTCQGAVQRQINYGRQRGTPWGISESGYNATDAMLNYQYRGFGVPGLGLKRGLADDLVITPHASMLALMVAPEEACENLQQLAAAGAAGRYGLYEAIDYTPARLPRGQKSAVVRSFMAHHQGMGLLALAHLLQERPMQRYFESDPRLQAALLLLQERVPRVATVQLEIGERAPTRTGAAEAATPTRVVRGVDSAAPEVQLLSNGRYHVMVTNSGGGYSRWNEFAVTRWHEDTTSDAWGTFLFLRDVDSAEVWSTAHQPTRTSGAHYETIFTEGRAEFRRRDAGIETHTEIVVSPEDDIELRRVRVTNSSATRRTVEVTSYAEVVLASAAGDALHPAFSKLFVQTEILESPAAVLATRRARSPQEVPPWMFQLMAVHPLRSPSGILSVVSAVTHETDRSQFIGRGNDLASAAAMRSAGPLPNRAGPVLDPIAASRCSFTLEPDQSAIVDVVIGAGASRADCVALAEKYRDRQLAERVFELAWTHSQVVLRQLNASEVDAELYARMASAVIYAQPGWRADSALLARNRRGQSGLWGYAISGDLPIVLLQMGSADNVELARQMVQAHAWWRLKGLAVDLVIWNEERDIYRQRLQEQITGLIAAGVEAHFVDRPGGIFVRHVEQIAHEDRILLQSVARVVISDSRGTLAEQVNRRPPPVHRPTRFVASRPTEQRGESRDTADLATPQPRSAEVTGNGIGGFSADGNEYVVAPPVGARPPAPWVNVLANPRFGCVISEAGSAYTWCENAHELRLTPWHNDPVGDASGEAIFLRDEETGDVWSPTSLPCAPDPTAGAFTARHGFGYSVFEHVSHGIRAELTVFVAIDAAVKFSVLRLTNESGRPRKLTATGYVEWVLGDLRSKSAPHIVTEIAADNGALYARNPYNNDYGSWIGFFDVDEARRAAGSYTCDRTEFIGRNGSLRQPAALGRTRLGARAGPALDPCAAIQVSVSLLDGEGDEVAFRLGMGRSTNEAGELVARFRGRAASAAVLAQVRDQWRATLGAVQVRTPDPALNVLANGWLLYQTIACRLWARSGFYQSGGAFGFRDQLQDTMALVHSQPRLLRAQLLLCASRQFIEGDVQHWWHPPQGRGVRTRISDDYLWLPLALTRYVETSGDTSVLDEVVPYLEGRAVNPPDDAYYDLPVPSGTSASLYQHASEALWRGLRFGAHGLPLMGTGDWNDGMNLVGHEGRGESVWLGFFLCDVLGRFASLAQQHGDDAGAVRCRTERERLQAQLEAHGWDGSWYRRAYFDDGTPLGSSGNAECQIDSIAQSWSVLSGAAAPDRARLAMESMYTRLVRPDAKLALLLDPPFDQKGPSPGYIAGYVPGVRENGGQYNHAAIWAAMAFASLGERARAWSLLEIINPVKRTATASDVERYKVEPYVLAADVYTRAPHTGRGGWSWYTGSAGWLYRLIVESLLGLQLQTTAAGARLLIVPCLPLDWPGYAVEYRYGRTRYDIEVNQVSARAEPVDVHLDGERLDVSWVPLADDGRHHTVVMRIGELA
jgi:cellobiose phosphorylase